MSKWRSFDDWAEAFDPPNTKRVDNGAGTERRARAAAYEGIVPESITEAVAYWEATRSTARNDPRIGRLES